MARVAKVETLLGKRWETHELVSLLLTDPDGGPARNNEPWSTEELIDRCIEDCRQRALTEEVVGPTGDAGVAATAVVAVVAVVVAVLQACHGNWQPLHRRQQHDVSCRATCT